MFCALCLHNYGLHPVIIERRARCDRVGFVSVLRVQRRSTGYHRESSAMTKRQARGRSPPMQQVQSKA